jgi:hypothetical protein
MLFNSLDIPPDRDTYATLSDAEETKQNHVTFLSELKYIPKLTSHLYRSMNIAYNTTG